jgi:hypothetical protein
VEENLHQLEIAILALGCCQPKGSCLQVQGFPVFPETPTKDIIDTLKANCRRSSVNLLVVEHESSSTDTDNLLTLLVQEAGGSSTGTKYNCCQYRLDDICSLMTREPREQTVKLSFEDLVSHRTTGVDNTGNICVWDSERTLAYLLYHHFEDIIGLPPKSSPIRSILELGTGMAGLAAISLGLRIVQLEEEHPSSEYKCPKIQVTLTDGHVDGVKNNLVNQYLTKAFANANTAITSSSDDEQRRHPYQKLDVSAKVLLWTTDLSPATTTTTTTTTKKEVVSVSADVVLVSDCIHFQNFHAALAITTLRSLRVGGTAIFCQPQRGDSLENFCTLLKVTVPTTTIGLSLLASLEWKTHPLLEEQHLRALKENNSDNVYDPNLHQPKLLLVTKLRELTEEDCQAFVVHQKERDVK